MATFGFSVGDFIAFLGVVKDVTNALKESTGSASTYRSLIHTLEALNQALTTSGLIYLQWENVPAAEAYKKDARAMINGMLFHRQQCKELIEKFIESTQSYENAFLGPFLGRKQAMKRNVRKITWLFQKDKVLRLEKDLQRHLTAMQIYSDGLLQNQMGAHAAGLSSNMERILSSIAHVQADTSLISTTLQSWQRPVISNLGYTWEDTSSLAQSVLLLDSIGRNIPLPLLFFSSPRVFHDLLFIMFQGVPGTRKILRREYALTEESEEATLIEEDNWGTLIRPGMKLSLNMTFRTSLSWNNNHCPRCKESTFGHSLPSKRIRCQKCQLIYSLFEYERLVEDVQVDPYTRPAIQEWGSFFTSNRNSNPANLILQTASRATQRIQHILPEEFYFKRVHFHREIPKLISLSSSAPKRQNFSEETPRLDVNSLPLLHRAAAQGLSDTISQLLDDGEEVDQSLPFGAHLRNDGSHCEFEGCTPLHLACWYGHVKSIKLLLDRGASINTKSAVGKQALSFAILGEDPGVAIVLLQRHADVNNRDKSQQTTFHDACSRSNAFLVHQLLEYGADLEAKNGRGRTALHSASSRGLEDVVKALLDHDADIAAQDGNGETPLHRASWNRQESVVKVLLERGADTEIQTKKGHTALHEASSSGCDPSVDILLEHGANLDVPASNGSTALHEAASRGFTSIVQRLIDKGATIEVEDKWGRSPLHEAALNGHLEVIRCLIKNGARGSCRDKIGNTPLHSACLQVCNRDVTEVIQLLLENGAEIDAQCEAKRTPLHLACSNGNHNVAMQLVSHGANAYIPDKEGLLAIHDAASTGMVDFIRLLLRTQDPSPKAGLCFTPLHFAASENQAEAITILAEAGADLDARVMHLGFAPIHWAVLEGHFEAIRTLAGLGADLNIRADWIGLTPLQLADTAAIVELLLDLGADPQIPMACGLTNQEWAIFFQEDDIANLYSKRNGNTNCVFNPRDIHLLRAIQTLQDQFAAIISISGEIDLCYGEPLFTPNEIREFQEVIEEIDDFLVGEDIESKTISERHKEDPGQRRINMINIDV